METALFWRTIFIRPHCVVRPMTSEVYKMASEMADWRSTNKRFGQHGMVPVFVEKIAEKQYFQINEWNSLSECDR
jgi:hypothetical protein